MADNELTTIIRALDLLLGAAITSRNISNSGRKEPTKPINYLNQFVSLTSQPSLTIAPSCFDVLIFNGRCNNRNINLIPTSIGLINIDNMNVNFHMLVIGPGQKE